MCAYRCGVMRGLGQARGGGQSQAGGRGDGLSRSFTDPHELSPTFVASAWHIHIVISSLLSFGLPWSLPTQGWVTQFGGSYFQFEVTFSANDPMLPYQGVMDYTPFQRLPGPHPAAFSHSWFVPADLCVPYKQNHTLLEPGHVILSYLYHSSLDLHLSCVLSATDCLFLHHFRIVYTYCIQLFSLSKECL